MKLNKEDTVTSDVVYLEEDISNITQPLIPHYDQLHNNCTEYESYKTQEEGSMFEKSPRINNSSKGTTIEEFRTVFEENLKLNLERNPSQPRSITQRVKKNTLMRSLVFPSKEGEANI